MKKKLFISLAVIIPLIAVFAVVGLSRNTPKLLKNNKSADELMSKLDSGDFEQIKDELNEVSDKYNYNDLYTNADKIKDKITKIHPIVLTQLVTSKLIPVNMRCLLIDICDNEFSPIILDYDKLIKMLTDTEENESLRSSVLIYLNQPYTYSQKEGFSDILYSLCFDEADLVSEFALQGLYASDRRKAIPVIQTILYENTDVFAPKTVNRAFDYMALELKNHSSEYMDGKEKEKFFNLCEGMLNKNKYCVPILFALIDINSPEGAIIVLNSPHSNDDMKTYCVSHNYYSIRNWVFDDGVTAEKVDFFLDCLSYFHALEAVPELQKILSDAPELFGERSDYFTERINTTIDEIEKIGSHVSGK